MTVETYVEQFSGEALGRLQLLRRTIMQLAPGAVESYSYGLIGYKLNGKPLVYIGGFAKHIGFYATPNGHEAFAAEFAPFKQGKGSVQLPLDQELPLQLITNVVNYRIEQCGGRDALPFIGAPAASALAEIGITKASQIAKYSEQDLLKLHGVGPKAIKLLREAGVSFKNEN